MSLYLLRRYRVPGWQALSSMIFLGLLEIYQLLLFSAFGVMLNFHLVVEASTLMPLDTILPAIFIAALIYLPLHIAYFRGRLLRGSGLRDKQLLLAFRNARPIHYLLVVLFKAPNLLGAVVVYTIALDLFQVDVSLGQMLAFLPVIFLAAALPLPFHAGALLLWTVLFPDYPEVGVFSLVMHTFFVLFNAVIGVLFLAEGEQGAVRGVVIETWREGCQPGLAVLLVEEKLVKKKGDIHGLDRRHADAEEHPPVHGRAGHGTRRSCSAFGRPSRRRTAATCSRGSGSWSRMRRSVAGSANCTSRPGTAIGRPSPAVRSCPIRRRSASAACAPPVRRSTCPSTWARRRGW